MRKEFKLASVAGAILMSGSAFAALPGGAGSAGDAVRYQNLGSGTNLSLPTFCQNTGSCFKIASGDGFVQYMVAGENGQVGGGIPSGEVYIYTYIAEGDPSANASLDNYFRDISFVQMSSNNPVTGATAASKPGIYGRQIIKEPDATGSFYAETNLAVGDWAKQNTADPSKAADITLKQTLADNGGTLDQVGDDFKTTFDFASVTTSTTTGGVTTKSVSKTMDIGQWLGLEVLDSTKSQEMTAGDAQAFAYRSMSGIYNPKAGKAGTGRVASNGTKQYVDWNAGDTVAATWIGQTLTINENDYSAKFMDSDFAYLSYQNKSKAPNASGRFESRIGFNEAEAVYNFDNVDNGLWKAEFSGGVVDRTYFGYEPCLSESSVTGAKTAADPACTK
ncbi:MAG: hypothetical protein OEW58_09810 [Gammaproteobacteria bacterium]|nr:hypothetical protein [Gammaproteobacteria bacterium]